MSGKFRWLTSRRAFLIFVLFFLGGGLYYLLVPGMTMKEEDLAGWPPWKEYAPLELLQKREKEVSGRAWSFVGYGDSKGFPFHRDETVPFIEKLNPTLIINTGDMVDRGYGIGARDYDWPKFGRETQELRVKIPFFPCLGNHEFSGRDKEGKKRRGWRYSGSILYELFYRLPRDSGTELYYSFSFREATFICLDTLVHPLKPGSRQWIWMAGILEKASTPFVIVFAHEPVFTVGRREDFKYKKELVEIFCRHRVSIHLSAHDHIYYRTRRSGICFVISAGAGAPMYSLKRKGEALNGDVYFSGYGKENPEDHFYVVLFEVTPAVLKGKTLSVRTGRILDSFDIPKRF